MTNGNSCARNSVWDTTNGLSLKQQKERARERATLSVTTRQEEESRREQKRAEESRVKRQETRVKSQETRDKKRKAEESRTDKRQETRDEKREEEKRDTSRAERTGRAELRGRAEKFDRQFFFFNLTRTCHIQPFCETKQTHE